MVKGKDSWYTVYDSEMLELFCRHVLGNFTRGMTAHPDREDSNELFGPGSDWSLDLGDNAERVADHRPLLAAMVLLLEHTIRSDQAG